MDGFPCQAFEEKGILGDVKTSQKIRLLLLELI
jgi:hypothetical protein